MNYLLHLYLAEDTSESILGNLMGDFIKGSLDGIKDVEILKGIITHRKVDSFAEKNKWFILSKRLITTHRRRFAGIIVDLSFDHFLAKNWGDFSDVELEDFIQKVYRLLTDYKNILPDRLKEGIPKLISEDWLGSYKDINGMGIIMDRVSRRIKRSNNLEGAVVELISNYEKLEGNFRAFLPELKEFVKDLRKNRLLKSL